MPSESKRWFIIYLIEYLKFLKYDEQKINKDTFIEFLVKSELSANSKALIARRLGNFLCFYNYITQEEFNSIKKVYRLSTPDWSSKALNIEEIPRILKAIDRSEGRRKLTFLKCRNLLLIYLMAATGCRVSQICDLKKEDVIIDNGQLIIAFKYQKKNLYNTNKEQKNIIKINLQHQFQNFKLSTLIEKYMKFHIESEYFFHTKEGEPLSTVWIRNYFTLLSKRLNKKITPHTLRHTAGTYIANEYGVLKASIVLGHSNISTTQRYICREKIDTSNFLPTI